MARHVMARTWALGGIPLLALVACGPAGPGRTVASAPQGVAGGSERGAAPVVHLHAVKALIEDRLPTDPARCERRDRQVRTTFAFDALSAARPVDLLPEIPPPASPRALVESASLPPPEEEEELALPAAIARASR